MTMKRFARVRPLGLCAALALVAGLSACGGDEAGRPAVEPGTLAEGEMPPMMPEATPTRPKPIPVGEQHYRDALAELENQLAVEWLEHEGTEIYVGVVRSAYENDKNPIVEAALRAQKTKGEPVTVYVVDVGVADEGWRPGGDGILDTLSLPLQLNFQGSRDEDVPVDQ